MQENVDLSRVNNQAARAESEKVERELHSGKPFSEMTDSTNGSPNQKGEQTMHNHDEHHEYSNEEIQAYAEQGIEFWKSDEAPQIIETEAYKNKLFTAGGGLVLSFGDKDSEVWKLMTDVAEGDQITIASKTFDINNLALMGDFYRWTGKELACIDERLDMNQETGCQIHDKCGACGGVEAAIRESLAKKAKQAAEQSSNANEVQIEMPFSVATQAAAELAQAGKGTEVLQPTSSAEHLLKHHESVVIYVHTSSDGRAAKADRSTLIENHALAFNASIPLDLIETYATKEGLDRGRVNVLIDTMVTWNAEIAKVIIDGHNNLGAAAEVGKTLTVFDKRATKAPTDELQKRLEGITAEQITWEDEMPMAA